MLKRPRRLRSTPYLRAMVRETRMSAGQLVYPIFITEGSGVKEEINAMPGQYRYSIDRMGECLEEVTASGVGSVLLFGIPQKKDETGSGAYDDNGIIQRALRYAKENYPELYYITDVCMCEYTSHGHCGITDSNGYVDNDKTLPLIARAALSHARAGADMVAPSDMMDGRVGAVRAELDKAGYINVPVMAYSAKYASAFYGPFREAALSAPMFGDRKSYQMDPHNVKEALKETALDISEGADIVMVKPGLAYLDVLSRVSAMSEVPVAVYSVSGEYSMIKAAAALGYADEEKLILETAVSMFRAGADILITHFAKEIAAAIKKGLIG